MPYYSVSITGGEDCEAAGREAREMFRGRDADYVAAPNFFYVQTKADQATLQRNLSSFEYDGYTVTVSKIKKAEFEWRRHQ